MNTQQIISSLAETLGCEEKEAVQYVDAVVRWMTEQTAENGELLIPGFGRFEVTKQMEYVRCDANTQKRYLVPPSLSVSFVPAPLLEGTKESTKNVFEAITEMLVAKEKVEKHVAERFPVTFFKGILDAMERGETVSVPQLGSFLLTKVRLAEKVFGKVSFTPDSAFDEWVNRPFSYLPEVELNDGVEFDDITIVSPYDSIHEPSEEDKTFLILTEPVSPPETPEVSASPASLESPDTPDTPDTPASPDTPSSPDTPASSPSRSRFWMYGLPLLALAIGLLSLLLHLRHQDNGASDAVSAVDTIGMQDSTSVAEAASLAEAASPADTINYDAMNAQIPYGAYDIVGIDTVITVMPGQDLATISRIFLGTDIHIYLIVANYGNNNPQEGEKYRIPRLKPRKK
ncbi:MAG: HU family DNA-binding protein [Prevotella sp.]|nr:HU family DNA-binding protein [Prevotella sp.]